VRIDPHTHSACSDGTDSPAELMEKAAGAGLDVVGLTDHDTMAGWQEAARAVPDTGVALLRGTEISCAADGVTLHLLSYLHRADDAGLEAAFARARRSRDSRAQRMVERLSQDYPVTWEDVLTQSADSHTIGRPHIADALVAAGSFPDRNAAFAGPLATSSPYYVHHWALDPVEACRLVRAAGGVPGAAHPRAAPRQRRLVPDETFARMAEAVARESPGDGGPSCLGLLLAVFGGVIEFLGIARRRGLIVARVDGSAPAVDHLVDASRVEGRVRHQVDGELIAGHAHR